MSEQSNTTWTAPAEPTTPAAQAPATAEAPAAAGTPAPSTPAAAEPAKQTPKVSVGDLVTERIVTPWGEELRYARVLAVDPGDDTHPARARLERLRDVSGPVAFDDLEPAELEV